MIQYDESNSINIKCSGSTCIQSDIKSVIINKKNVTISSDGTYVLESGEADDEEEEP